MIALRSKLQALATLTHTFLKTRFYVIEFALFLSGFKNKFRNPYLENLIMAAKQVVFGDDARAKVVNGVNVLANAVKVTWALKVVTLCWNVRSAHRQ